ncbi:hypothetical protein T439DRAFT_321921 [Meredithblackwellia eburnea MCA 4105]
MSAELLKPLPQDLKEVSDKATAANALAAATIQDTIDRLERARQQIISGEHPDQLLPLSSYLKTANTKVAGSHKDWSSAVSKFGKGVEKKFSTPLVPLFPPAGSSSQPPPPNVHPSLLAITSGGATSSPLPTPPSSFGSPIAIGALNETIALHLARIGAFTTLSSFLEESKTTSPSVALLESLRILHVILAELSKGICTQALEWVSLNPESDPERRLEFELRKEEFVRILLRDVDLTGSTDPLLPTHLPSPSPTQQEALAYAGLHFSQLWTIERAQTICALAASPLFMPFSKLLVSPYASLFADYAPKGDLGSGKGPESKLQAIFAAAFLKTIHLPKDSPLTVVTDVGGGGAMARIQKVRMVMKEKKTEWSAVEELPVEIPLPTTHRYHSIFACPVSKEQSTPSNPPMLLPCGHVIARESLTRLARGTPTVKCPYCPVISHTTAAVRVHF